MARKRRPFLQPSRSDPMTKIFHFETDSVRTEEEEGAERVGGANKKRTMGAENHRVGQTHQLGFLMREARMQT